MTKGRLGTGLIVFLALISVAGGCGGGSEGPVSGRVIVENIKVSLDGNLVESIMVRTEDGKELTLRLSEEIDPSVWSPQHLQGHVQGGKRLGLTIGVQYLETDEDRVATGLFE